MIRTLFPNQTFDPARGSFIVHAQHVRDTERGPVFVAPAYRSLSGEIVTFSNSIEFRPTERN